MRLLIKEMKTLFHGPLWAFDKGKKEGGGADLVLRRLNESLAVNESQSSRELTEAERHLVRWMLEHGEPEAWHFLDQLDQARVTSWRCPCGCASINFSIDGQPEPSGGLHTLADFVFGDENDLSGIFVYEQSGVLSGLEVYGFAGDAPSTLPTTDILRPF